MKIKLVGILGSPRKGGNSEILLDQALKGATETGAGVEKITLANLDFSGCTECGDCYQTGECSIDDDMRIIYEAIDTADRIILASPIFFMGLPSQTKAMIDRTQCYWATKYVLKEPSSSENGAAKLGAFIGVGATRGESLFDGTNLTLKYFFDAIGVKPLTELYLEIRGVDEKGEIREHPDLLDSARDLGEKLAVWK